MIALTPKRYASGRRFSFEAGHNGLAERHGYRWRKPTWAKRWRPSFVFKMQFGPGPGYVKWNEDRTKVLVHGWGLVVAFNSGSRQWARRFSTRSNSSLNLLAWHTGIELHLGRRAQNGYYLSS